VYVCVCVCVVISAVDQIGVTWVDAEAVLLFGWAIFRENHDEERAVNYISSSEQFPRFLLT